MTCIENKYISANYRMPNVIANIYRHTLYNRRRRWVEQYQPIHCRSVRDYFASIYIRFSLFGDNNTRSYTLERDIHGYIVKKKNFSVTHFFEFLSL